MNNQVRTGIRSLIGLGLASSTLFWFIAFRFISFPVLIVAWVLFKRGGKNFRPLLIAWAVWLLLRR